jgi:adenylate cyclase
MADVVGFSRLMQADEVGTLAGLRARRSEVLAPVLKMHGGRIAKLMGDGVLVEFSSAVEAVQAALELQRRMASANADLPEAKRIVLRIGINLGDVIGLGSDIYGDGVNIAARIEALAEPAGICISAKVYEEVAGKLAFTAVSMGEQVLKNIARPVLLYRVSEATEPSAAMPPVEPAGAAATDRKPLSIAVLPFTNLSGQAEEDYFSDGITEDLITELARFKDLFVIARNSAFTFKGQAVDVAEVGRRLGARYVVEGSVRKAGSRIRVNAQLIESATATHLWAERYDRDLADIFAVQDELVSAISGIIPAQINRKSVEELRRKPPANPTAYDCELRGRWAMAHWNEGLKVALAWFEKAVRSDPDYALAHAGMAMAYAYGIFMLGLPSETVRERAKEHAARALVLDHQNPTVNAYATFCYHLSGEPQQAMAQAARAVALNPNDPFALYVQACALTYIGRPREALDWFARSERVNPYAPDDQRLDTLCDCYYMLRDYQSAIAIYSRYQDMPSNLLLPFACNLVQAGQTDRAREAVEDHRRQRPADQDTLAIIAWHIKMCARQEDRDHWREGYRKAGFAI